MTTFHLFPCLPFELRAQIWEMTVEPRTVDVQVVIKYTTVPPDAPRGPRPWVPRLISSTPVPATLQTCQEARKQGLYQQAFTEIAAQHDTEQHYVWLNLDIDMLSIGTTPFAAYKPVAPMIQRLKFERENGDEGFYHFEVRELHDFVNVKEIHVVCANGMGLWYGALEDDYWPCGEENVFMIDPIDGRMMRGIEMDEMYDQEYTEAHRLEGYDYATGQPLS